MHPRDFLTSLISSISSTEAPPATTTSNPLLNAPDSVRKALLTLHVLFPHELLPALDLLDRNLVTRLVLRQYGQQQMNEDPSQLDSERNPSREDQHPTSTSRDSPHAHHAETYIVQSAHPATRSRANTASRDENARTTNYQIHLQAWNCSCPAFTFAAFPALDKRSQHDGQAPQVRTGPIALATDRGWNFGGLSVGSNMPVCKHLLACVLVEHSGLFAHLVEQREVSEEELAGWAAGWGD